MSITVHIEAKDAAEYKALVKELYASIKVQAMPQPEVTRLPPDPRLHGSNVMRIVDKLRFHIEESATIGGCFSSAQACLILGVKSGQLQSGLQTLKKEGMINMVQKGIWKRII